MFFAASGRLERAAPAIPPLSPSRATANFAGSNERTALESIPQSGPARRPISNNRPRSGAFFFYRDGAAMHANLLFGLMTIGFSGVWLIAGLIWSTEHS
jgi:hypothetical protein